RLLIDAHDGALRWWLRPGRIAHGAGEPAGPVVERFEVVADLDRPEEVGPGVGDPEAAPVGLEHRPVELHLLAREPLLAEGLASVERPVGALDAVRDRDPFGPAPGIGDVVEDRRRGRIDDDVVAALESEGFGGD